MLEEQLVHLFVSAMTEEDETGVSDDSEALWRNLSSELIFSVLFQYITFPTFVTSVTEKLKKLKEVLISKLQVPYRARVLLAIGPRSNIGNNVLATYHGNFA